jgi:hypothetical protein
MAKTPFASGRAGGASVEIQVIGLYPFLKRAAAADPMFNKEIRAASVKLIGQVVTNVQSAANSAPNRRQAVESAKGFRARPDRVPVIKLNGSAGFVSQSRPNRKRKTKVTRGDVFFGSEFGSDRLKQFPARSARFFGGNSGYYFWPTIERMSGDIREEYLNALDSITNKLKHL